MLSQASLTEFLDALASSRPAPGGGSAAALDGAVGASLLRMVCHVTLADPDYTGVHSQLEALLRQIEPARRRLVHLIDADAAAANALIPLLHEREQSPNAGLATALQSALQRAADVSLEILEACVEMLDLCMPAASLGKREALSDVGAAAASAGAGASAAMLTARFNLSLLEDPDYVCARSARLNSLAAGAPERTQEIFAHIASRLPVPEGPARGD